MKKLFITFIGTLLLPLITQAQTQESEESIQKRKAQQALSYYQELVKRGEENAKKKVKSAEEFLRNLEQGVNVMPSRRATEENIYIDSICNVFYKFNPKDGTACVLSGSNKEIVILESFIVDGKTYSVTSIGSHAFQSWGIQSIYLPKSIISISSDAFYLSCINLQEIKVAEDNPVYDSRNNCNAIIDTTNTLVWGCKGTVIPDGVVAIGDDAFHYTECPEHLTFPSSVVRIGDDAFAQRDSIKSVHIPATLTEFYRSSYMIYNPFWACSNLSEITVDEKNPKYNSRNNCNAIIETETNILFVGCNGTTVIPDGVVGITWQALYLDCVLQSLHIPASVISLDISDCTILNGITVDPANLIFDSRNNCNSLIETSTNKLLKGCINSFIPEDIMSIGSNAFQSLMNLKAIALPDGLTEIGSWAFGSTGLKSINIPESVTNIGYGAFSYCNLDSIACYIRLPFPINSYEFNRCLNSATLYVPSGTVDLYKSTDGWKEFANIVEMQNDASFSFQIVDGSGVNVTANCNITWYDSEGNIIGTGTKLNGVADSTEVYYSVLLDENLGRKYREVIKKKMLLRQRPFTYVLETIPKLNLAGRVSVVDIETAPATIYIEQMLNGKYEESFTAQTNEKGEFSVEVFDDISQITISREDCVASVLHQDGFGGVANLGTIQLKASDSYEILANITLNRAVAENSPTEAIDWTGGLNDLDFTLFNTTKNAAITFFKVQSDRLIVRGVSEGDEILLTANSKQGVFPEATTRFIVMNVATAFNLQLTEYGGLTAICGLSSNPNTIGYLYNGNGELMTSSSYIGDSLSLQHLTSGTYTLISMGQSLRFAHLSRLADLESLGLNIGMDYIESIITVKDGKLTMVNIPEIPKLDDSRISYLTGKSYFNSDKSSLIVGNYLTLSARIDFKAAYKNSINNVVLTVDLPEGCQLVKNSVIANWNVLPYTVNGSQLRIALKNGMWENPVRFSIIPTLNKSYMVTAVAETEFDGLVSLPIGTAKFEVMGLSLNLPSKTIGPNITVNGTANGHAMVSIYDNDVLIGKTYSNYAGEWTASCELYKPYDHSFHNIYAKLTTNTGLELTSETRQVEYEKNNNILPKKVTMLYYNREFDTDYKIVFDLIGGTTIPSYYYYFPYKNWPDWWRTYETEPKDFTFLADFTDNDSTRIGNVNIKVLNSDGTIRTLPAQFDIKQNCWVATTKYASSSRLPQNATVEFDCLPMVKEISREEPIGDLANDMITSESQVESYLSEKMEVRLKDESETSNLLDCKMKNSDESFSYIIEKMDFADAEKMMDEKQFIYSENDSDIVATNTEWDDKNLTITCANLTTGYAHRITMSLENNAKSNRRSQLILNTTGVLGRVLDIVGITNYMTVNRDFENMSRLIESYTNKYNEVRSVLTKCIVSKCSNGEYKLSKINMQYDRDEINRISSMEDYFSQRYYKYLQEYRNRIWASLATDAISMGIANRLNAVIKGAKFETSVFNRDLAHWFGRISNRWTSRNTSSSIVSNILGLASNLAIDGTARIVGYRDFNGLRDNILSWAAEQNLNILGEYVELRRTIEKQYQCHKDKNEEEEKKDEPLDEKSENKPEFPSKGTQVIQDPSGYVYEAVFSNRMPNVTATVYQKINDEAVLWNAEDYSQQNPLLTDDNGFYRWDVPQGLWQVKYEKEGYETTYSDWLPVPPPQLDVNVGMKQSAPPTVKQVRGFEEGITMEMSKYMKPATFSMANIVVTRNGMEAKGSIEMLNSEKEPSGEAEFSSKFRFVPESRFDASDNVVLTIRKEVESYCGVNMTEDFVQTIEIEPEIKEIVADSLINVPYQDSKEIQIVVLPKEASAGKTLHASSSSSMVASLGAEEITLDENGSATVTLKGELPGGAYLTFNVEGTDFTAQSRVKVNAESDIVTTPIASIKSGETVVAGTLLELSCNTEGAVIYYTLDGSCPCDETKRIKYEGPITITSDVIVKAIAIKDDLEDSDIATFVYFLNSTGISVVESGIRIWPLVTSSTIHIDLNDIVAESVTVTSLNGITVASKVNAKGLLTIDLGRHSDGMYLVNIHCKDNKIVRKIIKVRQ